MRATILVSGLATAWLATGSAAPAAAQARDWQDVPRPPLRAFEPQQPRRVELPNGMLVLLQENHELPLVQGFARIRGGSRDEPADQAGLVSAYAQAWRTSGTTTRDGDALDDFLEARAARVETGGGGDSTVVSFDCLKQNLDEVFDVFVELLRRPAFREDKLDLARDALRTAIARRNDSPQAIAARLAGRLGYGPGSAYARTPEYATVAAIGVDDLVAWHAATVHPNRIVLGIAGDFDPAAFERHLREAFGDWARGPEWSGSEIPAGPTRTGVFLVARDDVNQSNVRLVHLGTRRDSPDFPALEVMNEVLGGGAASRLNTTIRTKLGLAYAVGGGVGTAFDHPGLFQVALGTRSETTAQAIDAVYQELARLRDEPPGEDELRRAKDSILNSFVFRFDSKEKVLAEQALYAFYGYPPDFMAHYQERIEAVTAEDVLRVARSWVHPDQAALLVVGRPADFDRPLSTFGDVEQLDVSIPPPPGAAAPTATDAAGTAALGRVVEALGGGERIARLSFVRQHGTLRAVTPSGIRTLETTTLVRLSGEGPALRQDVETPQGRLSIVVTPESAFAITPLGGVQDLPASRRESALTELVTAPLYVARHADSPEVGLGAVSGADESTGVFDVASFGASARWWVDSDSGRVVRTATRDAEGVEQTAELSDFRDVDGVWFAFARELRRDGADAGSVAIDRIELDPEVDPAAFARPEPDPRP